MTYFSYAHKTPSPIARPVKEYLFLSNLISSLLPIITPVLTWSIVRVCVLVSAFHASIREQFLPVSLSTIVAARIFNIMKEKWRHRECIGYFPATCSADVRGSDAIFSQIREQAMAR